MLCSVLIFSLTANDFVSIKALEMTLPSFVLKYSYVCIAGFSFLVLMGCAKLPHTPHLPDSIALTNEVLDIYSEDDFSFHTTVSKNHLKQALSEQALLHPNLSGYYPITTGTNAFAARSVLSTIATQTIDAQYYIWNDDEAGQLLLKDLWIAANRGIKVRLLLDDFNGSKKLDALLARFASHPNIAVRIVNPAVYRSFRPINFLTNPIRTNTRMHNKSITYDNRISIIGGRNIGNEYLNNDSANQFADLDVLLVGAIVPKITNSFNDYWNSTLSYDIETLTATDDKSFLDTLDHLDDSQSSIIGEHDEALKTYENAVKNSTIDNDLLKKRIAFRWVVIDFIGDNANKLGSRATQNDLLVNQLRQEFKTPQKQFTIISSYFVPTKAGVDGLVKLARQGVTVNILTNSYDATDVGAVHSGYAHHRQALLKAGINLYELKSTAKQNTSKNNKLWRTQGQTTTSLHAKAFAVDTHKVFIGSYNVDPRSANINTEMGVIIYDDKLATHFHNAFGDGLLNQAYRVKLNGDSLEWHTIEKGHYSVLTSEPNTQEGDKIAIALLSKLPIDWLL